MRSGRAQNWRRTVAKTRELTISERYAQKIRPLMPITVLGMVRRFVWIVSNFNCLRVRVR
jgi:hypothetical protein